MFVKKTEGSSKRNVEEKMLNKIINFITLHPDSKLCPGMMGKIVAGRRKTPLRKNGAASVRWYVGLGDRMSRVGSIKSNMYWIFIGIIKLPSPHGCPFLDFFLPYITENPRGWQHCTGAAASISSLAFNSEPMGGSEFSEKGSSPPACSNNSKRKSHVTTCCFCCFYGSQCGANVRDAQGTELGANYVYGSD